MSGFAKYESDSEISCKVIILTDLNTRQEFFKGCIDIRSRNDLYISIGPLNVTRNLWGLTCHHIFSPRV